ncbi:MAG: helix-hairpin-helix domain-containing protein [Bacteroidales bacterium]|nr:helix-hairpin-helix domain-containing protein [Bacteroidales bacterium]
MQFNLEKIFNYNKGQRRAIWLMVSLIVVLILFRFVHISKTSSVFNYDLVAQKIDSFVLAGKQQEIVEPKNYPTRSKYPEYKTAKTQKLRPFNPNTSDYETLINSGLTASQARNIVNFVAKGGQFYKKSDMLKIYSINQEDYSRLQPYILLPDASDKKAKEYTKSESYSPTEILELNTVTADELMRISGIGPVISKNILKYKSMLGGFYSANQLQEVYGIDSALFLRLRYNFTASPDSIQKRNLNKTDYYTLRKHPYVSNEIAFEISNHIKYKGKLKSLDDLRQFKTIDEKTLEKISFYFLVE